MPVSSRPVTSPFSELDDGHRKDGAGLILLFLAGLQSYDIAFLEDSVAHPLFLPGQA